MNFNKLLIVEDDPGLQSQMKWCFEDVEVFIAENADDTIDILRKETPAVVTLDLGLPPDPGGTSIGFQIIDQIQELAPWTKIIVITGREEKRYAIEAIARGAYDFYQKPIDSSTLNFVVTRAFRLAELEAENKRLAARNLHTPLDGLVTNSQVMLDLCRTVIRVAPSDVSVLLLGDTGTGKEVIARALHAISDRKENAFVAINCAAIPETLLESELFGHEKGAFTGAANKKIGKIESADGGTLFLDEIGDMPLSIQAKILRFLQERTLERLGGNKTIEVDVRVLTATHRSLNEMIEEQSFREDLFYRISEISFQIPPLAKREGDALLLAEVFMQRFGKNKSLRLSISARNAIESWDWPGNVRELENRIKRGCVMCEDGVIQAHDLELTGDEQGEAVKTDLVLNLKQVRDAAEEGAIARALEHCDDNVSKTAKLLGVSRPTLYKLLEKHKLGDHQ